MRHLITALLLFPSIMSTAQSPYLSVKVKMAAAKTIPANYKIEMKICQPKEMTKKTNWFTHDTSKIDFSLLKPGEIDCGNYSFSGEGIEILSGDKKYAKYNFYEFGDQEYGWEKILVFKIIPATDEIQPREMFIVLPIKYKSFITAVSLDEIEFKAGKVLFLTGPHASYQGSGLFISQSLKTAEDVDVNDFAWKALLYP